VEHPTRPNPLAVACVPKCAQEYASGSASGSASVSASVSASLYSLSFILYALTGQNIFQFFSGVYEQEKARGYHHTTYRDARYVAHM